VKKKGRMIIIAVVVIICLFGAGLEYREYRQLKKDIRNLISYMYRATLNYRSLVILDEIFAEGKLKTIFFKKMLFNDLRKHIEEHIFEQKESHRKLGFKTFYFLTFNIDAVNYFDDNPVIVAEWFQEYYDQNAIENPFQYVKVDSCNWEKISEDIKGFTNFNWGHKYYRFKRLQEDFTLDESRSIISDFINNQLIEIVDKKTPPIPTLEGIYFLSRRWNLGHENRIVDVGIEFAKRADKNTLWRDDVFEETFPQKMNQELFLKRMMKFTDLKFHQRIKLNI
jgi:hypothetical protein